MKQFYGIALTALLLGGCHPVCTGHIESRKVLQPIEACTKMGQNILEGCLRYKSVTYVYYEKQCVKGGK